ncbi:hypothetical protein [Embleya hyalina]|uniref:hypothetical protein n=1 Tax=Embleya hyalina TaxID=516124 RepID=UPI000F821F5B|nr:hypothetical protein [Embleya hyalina]
MDQPKEPAPVPVKLNSTGTEVVMTRSRFFPPGAIVAVDGVIVITSAAEAVPVRPIEPATRAPPAIPNAAIFFT